MKSLRQFACVRFSLKALLAFMTLACLATVGVVKWQASSDQQKRASEFLTSHGWGVHYASGHDDGLASDVYLQRWAPKYLGQDAVDPIVGVSANYEARISSECFERIGELSRLRKVLVLRTDIGDTLVEADFRNLGRLEELELLSLWDCKFQSSWLLHLRRCPLKELNLRNSQMDASVAKQLKQLLPDCHFTCQ